MVFFFTGLSLASLSSSLLMLSEAFSLNDDAEKKSSRVFGPDDTFVEEEVSAILFDQRIWFSSEEYDSVECRRRTSSKITTVPTTQSVHTRHEQPQQKIVNKQDTKEK